MPTDAMLACPSPTKPISRKQRQRVLAAARRARYRDRRERCIAAVIRAEVFEREIDALVQIELLQICECNSD